MNLNHETFNKRQKGKDHRLVTTTLPQRDLSDPKQYEKLIGKVEQ